MKPRTWFEADHKCLIREYRAMQAAYPSFRLRFEGGHICWEGGVADIPMGVTAAPLRVRVVYPSGFPIVAIQVFPISPDLPPEHWGHTWHRWLDGKICFMRPDQWDPDYTARDVTDKVTDWYYNYLAFLHHLIPAMPDQGRADLANRLS